MQQYKPLTMRRNFSWAFIGNVVYAACQWGMLMVLAKLGSPEMVGQFSLGLAYTAPVFMLTNLQLRDIQVTDAKRQYLFGDYLGLRLVGTGLALLIIVGIIIVAGYRWETSLVILVIGLAKAFESISDVFYALIQQQGRMDRIALSLMIKGPLSLLMLGIGVYLTGSVLWGAAGLAIVWALVLISCDIPSGALILKVSSLTLQENIDTNPSAVSLLPRWHLRTLGQLVWLALPLGFVMMVFSLNTNIPRYFIQYYLGERQLGIFASIAYLMVAGNIVVSALAQSASPRLAKYYVEGNSDAFRTLLLKLVGIAVLLGGAAILVTVIAGREILNLLYTPEYAEHKNLFVWMMAIAGINYVSWFLGEGMTAARYLRIQMPISILAFGSSSITCFYLVPISGLRGAVIALTIAAIVQLSISCGVVFHAIHRLYGHQAKELEYESRQ